MQAGINILSGGLDHRLGLADADLEPIGADERETPAGGHIAIHTHHGNTGGDRGIDGRDERARIPPHHHHASRLAGGGLFDGGDEARNVHGTRAGDADCDPEFLSGEPERRVIVLGEERQVGVGREPHVYFIGMRAAGAAGGRCDGFALFAAAEAGHSGRAGTKGSDF